MEINFSKIKEVYFKYKILITLITSTILFSLACFWTPFIVLAWIVLGVSFTFSKIQEILGYVLYFMMFSRNTIFFIGVGILAFIAIFVKYIIDLVKKRVETYKIPLLFTTLFCLAFIPLTFYYSEDFHRYNTEFQGVVQGLLFIGIMYVIYLLFCYRKQINLSFCFNMLFYGIVASGIVCLILYFIPSAEIAFYDVNDFIYLPVRDLVFSVDVDCSRLMLLSYHANHLASYCMVISTYSIYYLMNNNYTGNEKKYLYYALMFFIVTIIGIFTMSKAFLLVTVLILIYAIIFFIIKLKKHSIFLIVPVVIIVLVGAFVFRGTIEKIIHRFSTYEDGETFFGILTTGRSVIWDNYKNELLSSPWKLIFGKGLFQVEIITIGPHNMYIEIIYRVGLFGLLLLGVLCYLYMREVGHKLKFSLKKFLPLFIFLVHSIQEANFDERFLFLILSIMLLFESKESELKEDVKKEGIDNSKNNENTNKIETNN